MSISKTQLEGVVIIEPKIFGDSRGWFYETYNKEVYAESGIDHNFVQDNHSFSALRGTLRGLHFQNHPYAQTKLVRCTQGAILDVAVDIRRGSPTYLQHIAVELSADNKKQLLIPKGFAHGFITLTDNTEVQYKVDNLYSAQHDRSIRYDDPQIGIDWAISNPTLSKKDAEAPLLKDSDCNFSKRVLVTGAKGQLGFDVIRKLKSENYECYGADIDNMDITDAASIDKLIGSYQPDCIVHCAAYTAVDKAEDEQDKCYDINVTGTQNLVTAAKKIDAKFIYISTDYVYDGSGNTPIKEDATVSPLSTYGKSKLMGEKAVIDHLDKYFILRTSWVFGINGNNFVKTMLRLAEKRDTISVVSDQIGSPTYTPDLSELIFWAVNSQNYGVYNASNEGFCSWYDFACEIMAQAGMDTDIKKINTAQYPTKAKRPLNSRLSKQKLTDNGFKRLPTWQNALKRYLEELQ